MIRNPAYGSLIALAVLLGTMPVPSAADTRPPSGDTDADTTVPQTAGMDEIIVTARKREEGILDTPVSLTVISGAKLDEYGLGTMEQVATLTPNLYIDAAPTSARIAIRGLGTTGTAASFDQSVGLSIDGLFFGRARWFEVGVFDVEQIEVLRGPQGVYFGKNTTAGLINVRTRGPGDQWDGHVRSGFEFRQDEWLMEGAAGGPLSDTVGIRIAAQQRTSNGYLRNVALDRREPGLDQGIGRVTLDWTPSERLYFVYKGQYARSRIEGQLNQTSICTEALEGLLAAFASDEDCVFNNTRTAGNRVAGGYNRRLDGLDNESWSQSLTADVQLGDYALTSITGYHDQDVISFLDSDFTDLDLLHLSIAERYKQFSQEVRLESPAGRLFEVVAGAYYEDTELDTTLVIDYNVGTYIPFPLFGTGLRRYVQDGTSWALFGEVTLNLTEALRITAGGRYTDEQKKARNDQDLGFLGDPFTDDPEAQEPFAAIGWTEIRKQAKRSESDFSPAFSLQWDIADNVRSYVSYKEGFKSGGFDSNVANQAPDGTVPNFEYENENAKGYEAGLKFSALGNRLQVSAAAFRTKYSDLQVSAYLGLGQVATINAASVRSQGLELDAVFAATERLFFNAGVGYTEAQYTSFPNAPCYTLQTPERGCDDGQQDLGGKGLVLSPEMNATAGFRSMHDVNAALQVVLGADINYRDDVWLQLDQHPTSREDALWLVNAQVALNHRQSGWGAALIARNLFDEDYRIGSVPNGFFDGAFAALSGAPRAVQVQFTYKF